MLAEASQRLCVRKHAGETLNRSAPVVRLIDLGQLIQPTKLYLSFAGQITATNHARLGQSVFYGIQRLVRQDGTDTAPEENMITRRTSASRGPSSPEITGFYEPDTGSIQYVVSDPNTKKAAIIDAVWNFDPRSARTSTHSADEILTQVNDRRLSVEWILDTHPHADHFMAAGLFEAKTRRASSDRRKSACDRLAFGAGKRVSGFDPCNSLIHVHEFSLDAIVGSCT